MPSDGPLWRHSAREPQFAEHVERFRTLAVSYAQARLAPLLPDETLHTWAAETIVDLLVASVLHWLDHDDGGRDDVFVASAERSMRGAGRGLGRLTSTVGGARAPTRQHAAGGPGSRRRACSARLSR